MSVYDLDWAEGRAEANDLYLVTDMPPPNSPQSHDAATPLRCRLGFHQWRWTGGVHKGVDPYSERSLVRECAKCGKLT